MQNIFTVCISENKGQIPRECSPQQIAGILGVVKLLVGPYIIVVKGKKHVGKISGNDVWQLVEIDVIPLPKTKLHLNETQVKSLYFMFSISIFVLTNSRFYRYKWIWNI